MNSLESELERARELEVSALADAIESIGFECTRCGACCTAEADDPHTATVFPDEVRELQASEDYDWRDVARPMPYGLEDDGGDEGDTERDSSSGDSVADGSTEVDASDGNASGTTFEWALQTDACGDCAFYEERETDDSDSDGDARKATDDEVGTGYCTVHEDRPLVCRTYPFSVALGGTSQPMGEAVDEEGLVRAHECEGLGRAIDRDDALDLAAALKERAVRELEEAIDVRERYRPVDAEDRVVVFDSEGPKDVDGRPIDEE